MPAYLIADVEVNDPETYDEYRKLVPPMIATHGGRYLVRGGKVDVLEGDWQPRRMVVIEFPTTTHLQAFYCAAQYLPLKAMRMRASSSNLVAVEGI